VTYRLSWLEPGQQELLFRTLAAEHNWLAASHPDLPYPLLVAVGTAHGRLVCTGLLATGLVIGAEKGDAVAVTLRSLQRLRLSELLSQVAGGDEPMLRRVLRLADDATGIPRRRPGPKGYPPEHFQAVATAYRTTREEYGRGWARALARELETPEVTVRRWVAKARDMGLV